MYYFHFQQIIIMNGMMLELIFYNKKLIKILFMVIDNRFIIL